MAQSSNTIESLKMQYKVSGDGAPLVLLPGGLTGWVSWDAFIPEYSSSNKVIQVQLLSVQYGLENKGLPDNYSVRMESKALAESIKEAGIIAPVDYIGWSFGSFVLLDFALNHPHLVRSLVLIEPPAFWLLKKYNKVDKDTEEVMKFMNTLTGDISEKQLEGFMISVGFAPPGSSLKEHPQWHNWNKHRNSLRNSGQVVNHDDELSRLRNFNKPVLLVKGTGSAPFLHEIIHLLNIELPDVQLIEFPQGHVPHLVSKEAFMKEVNSFHQQIQ